MTFVRIDDVVVEYDLARSVLGGTRGKLRAVSGVSLEIERGTVTALVGESGSGKSTLGRASIALERPVSGTVEIDGTNLFALGRDDLRRFRRRMQIVFQDPLSSLNPRLTVGDQIAEGMRIHGLASRAEIPRRVGEILARVGLEPDDADRYPHQFSGGERQRIAIARSLAVEPEYLVLDEPVSALDVSIRAQILGLLWDLKEERSLTYLFITHDLSLAFALADRIAVMYLGRIVEEGPARDVLRTPRHPYTEALIEAIPDPDPDRATDRTLPQDEPPSPTAPPPGCPFHPRCPKAEGDCMRVVPPLREVETAHRSACLLTPGYGPPPREPAAHA